MKTREKCAWAFLIALILFNFLMWKYIIPTILEDDLAYLEERIQMLEER